MPSNFCSWCNNPVASPLYRVDKFGTIRIFVRCDKHNDHKNSPNFTWFTSMEEAKIHQVTINLLTYRNAIVGARIKHRPAIEDLARALEYNPESGVLVWKKGAHFGGKEAGAINPTNGRRYIKFQGVSMSASRLAWALYYKHHSDKEIDHIDRNPANNKIANLREATTQENKRNRQSSTRLRGAYKNGDKGWVARIRIDKKLVYLGSYPTQELAHKAYKDAAEKAHKHFYYYN